MRTSRYDRKISIDNKSPNDLSDKEFYAEVEEGDPMLSTSKPLTSITGK